MSGRRNLSLLGGLVLLVGTMTGTLTAEVVYVDADAPGANDGSNWADAYNFLQDALADAGSSPKPVEIRVAEGIYRPDEGANQTPGNREATFRLIKGVTLKGGYAGFGQPNPDSRDLNEYETILSGDLNGDDVTPSYQGALADEPSRAENAYHVVNGTGADQAATFHGFTVTGGNANAQGKDSQGGGMYNNSATLPVTDCTFRANSAETGGAMYNFSSSPTLANCTFAKNEAVSGGGVYNFFNSAPTLINCTFSNNFAYYAGGMTSSDGSVTLINCTFSGNNSALGYAGGMDNSRGNATLESCAFNRNSSAGWGAGGIYSTWNSTLQLSNCTFVANSGTAGGIYNTRNSSLQLTNCTFVANLGRAVFNGSDGQSAPSYLRAVNCIFWDGGNEIWNNDNSSVTITYSDVEGGWPGTGNIDLDPKFVDGDHPDPNKRDYHLTADSPCINMGDPDHVAEPNETDMDGESRVMFGRVDMGADEWAGPWVIYVDADATGDNNGSSWADAYNYLQDALSHARSFAALVEIRVAEGVYRPDEDADYPDGTGNVETTFHLINGVTIRGGYAGFGEPNPDARDVDLRQSVLSGDIGIPGDSSDNSYFVADGSDCDATAGLEGFTITNAEGEGIVCLAGSPTVANCKVTRNAGTGMTNVWGSSPMVTACTFSENLTGGMHNDIECNPVVSNCIFRGNLWSGMSNGNGSNAVVTNCVFSHNMRCGMRNDFDSSPIVTNCTFIANSVEQVGDWAKKGGGIWNSEGCSPVVTSCTFVGNSAQYGGAVYSGHSSPVLRNCTFAGNSAPNGNALACETSWPGWSSRIDAISCIFWDGGSEAWKNEESTVDITYSDVQGAWLGTGNIDADPRFVQPWPGGAVSYWRFDEGSGATAYDLVGNSHGTIVGAQWTEGQFGSALSFDGRDDYVSAEHQEELNITGDLTISAWVNFAQAGKYQAIVTKCVGAGGRNTPFDFRTNDNAEPMLAFVRADALAHERVYSSAKMTLGQWHHVLVRVENNIPDFYVDGAITGKYADTTFTRTPTGNTMPLLIGRRDNGLHFNGSIDDVIIFNRALSAEEIRELYEGGFGAFGDYHLLSDSPCINTGDPQFVAGPNDRDMDGESRVMLGRVDMGADEFNPFEAGFLVASRRRISRTVFEYECRVILENISTFTVRNVRLRMAKAASNMEIIEPDVKFGDTEVGPGESATSLDTCTIRVDRAEAIDEPEIIWRATCEMADTATRMEHAMSSLLLVRPLDRVDFDSLLNMAQHWLWTGTPGAIEADLVRDGRVDLVDFAQLARDWTR